MHPGTIVAGRWEILEPLGAGGVGDVYKARHRLTQALAALKVVRGRGGYTQETATRFAREAAAPAAIDHPGIANVIDAGLDPQSGQLYIASELLVGATLRAHMGPGALPLILAMLEPLAAAHAAGFVHRDLKPENIFVDQTRGVKLLDFGLVSDVDGTSATGTGEMMGTPWYMAPEQALSARDAETTADSWSVGVMIYEAVSGQRPYRALNMHAHVIELQTSHHTPLSIAAPGTPAALSALVDRCLDKHPTRRPTNAAELIRELSAIDLSAIDLSAIHLSEERGKAIVPNAYVATAPLVGDAQIDVNAPTVLPQSVPGTAPPGTAPPRASAPHVKQKSRLGCVVAAALAGLLVVVGVGGTIAYVQLSEEDTQTVTQPTFSVAIPQGWVTYEGRDPSSLAAWRAPGATPGGFATTASVVRYATDGRNTDEFIAAATANVQTQPGVSVLSNRSANMSGIEGRELEVGYPAYTQLQRLATSGSWMWMVTCAAPDIDPVRETCLQIFDSFQLRH